MRRWIGLLAVVTILVIAPQAHAFDFNMAVGMDFDGSLGLDEISFDTNTGYSLGIELVVDVPFVELGGGFEYSFDRDVDLTDAKLSYGTVYGVARVHILGVLYLAGRLGYTDVSLDNVTDLDFGSGASWSLGAGVSFLGKLKAEVLFNSLSSDLDYETYGVRLLYTF